MSNKLKPIQRQIQLEKSIKDFLRDVWPDYERLRQTFELVNEFASRYDQIPPIDPTRADLNDLIAEIRRIGSRSTKVPPLLSNLSKEREPKVHKQTISDFQKSIYDYLEPLGKTLGYVQVFADNHYGRDPRLPHPLRLEQLIRSIREAGSGSSKVSSLLSSFYTAIGGKRRTMRNKNTKRSVSRKNK